MKKKPSKRNVIGLFILFVIACLSDTVVIAQSVKPDKPNVIIILTDDQGSVDMNCYGAKDLHTPNMDKLAEGGIMFTQFYAAASVCSPSRAALMTGKTNLRAGLWGNVPVPAYAVVRALIPTCITNGATLVSG